MKAKLIALSVYAVIGALCWANPVVGAISFFGVAILVEIARKR